MPVSYSIRIDFDKTEASPERVFHAMALYIEGFNELQSAFMRGYSSQIDITTSLEATREGSCIADIYHKIKDTGRNARIGKLFDGVYYGILNEIASAEVIDSPADIKRFSEKVHKIAADTEPEYTHSTCHGDANQIAVADALHKIDKARRHISRKDNVQLGRLDEEFKDISSKFSCPRNGDQIFEHVEQTKPSEEILIVRRPSYVDGLKWEFDSPKRKKPVFAKMLDKEWLEDWNKHDVQIWPGDALLVKVKYTVKSNLIKRNSRTVDTDIIKVIRVIERNEMEQLELDINDET